MMQALVREGAWFGLQHRPRPTLTGPDQVLVRVVVAGLCRTDLYVAEGRLGADVILGHEFSGLVEELGPEVESLTIGDRVTVFPWLACGACSHCLSGWESVCPRGQMLGVDCDGGFAEFVVVPARRVFRLPDTVSLRLGAYVEPVAASLAVLRAGLEPHGRGLVYGSNRIAELTHRVLEAYGFTGLDTPTTGPLPPGAYDFIVETVATPTALAHMVAGLRPGGRLVLKSRQPEPISLDLLRVAPKQLTLQSVHYGSFGEALELVATNRLPLDDLLGEVQPLECYRDLFGEARSNESAKRFLGLGERDVWHR